VVFSFIGNDTAVTAAVFPVSFVLRLTKDQRNQYRVFILILQEFIMFSVNILDKSYVNPFCENVFINFFLGKPIDFIVK
jgi:hypothetical protein